MRKRLRVIDTDAYFSLFGVAKGRVKADWYLRGARIINVYTGEPQKANVAIKGKHIAYVGISEAMIGPDTEVADLTGYYLCPGYIEPHSHPFQIYNPDTLARFVLPHGTTALVNDNMGLYLLVNADIFLQMIDVMGNWPVKMLWSARLDPQTRAEHFKPFFEKEVIQQLLEHPLIVQAGELTAWPQLLNGDQQMAENMLETLRIGKRIEGHLPGASLETLSMLTAGGVTADHEAMTAEEAVRRLQIGLWTSLRYSSLRPDLPEIVKELVEQYKGDTKRLMMTTDGSTPAFIKSGYTDHMLQVAMDSGLDPITAYQMVTINPATYYGLDGEIGGIAPGRLADILVLRALDQPHPLAVMAEGAWAYREGKLLADWPKVEWEQYGLRKLLDRWRTTEADFSEEVNLPLIRLENPAITRYVTRDEAAIQLAAADMEATGGEPLLAVLFSGNGEKSVKARLEGMASRLDGLASSYTASKGILAMGQKASDMALAANRVLEMGGGIVYVEAGKVLFELELPVVGAMATEQMDVLISQVEAFELLLKERGHRHYDPIYTLLFLTSTHLPEIRLTPEGVLHVKSGEILREPSQR